MEVWYSGSVYAFGEELELKGREIESRRGIFKRVE
jgi:hypothetical protein